MDRPPVLTWVLQHVVEARGAAHSRHNQGGAGWGWRRVALLSTLRPAPNSLQQHQRVPQVRATGACHGCVS